jgi:hypothetical protein
VLGLTGQDWCVLPWMLGAAVADDVRPGSCHVECLRDSGRAAAWARAVQDYHRTRWPRWRSGVAAGVHWRLHAGPQAERLHLWRADGRLSSFPYTAVAGTRNGSLRLATDLAEVGSAHAAVLMAAMGTEDADVEVPLADVIAALDLTDRYPYGSGTVARRPAGAGASRRPEPLDVLVAHHPLRLDVRGLHAARELVRPMM